MLSPDSRANLVRCQAEAPLIALCRFPKPALWFIRVMPPEWNSDIQKRLRGHILRQEQKRHPNTRLKNLRLVHSGDGLAKH